MCERVSLIRVKSAGEMSVYDHVYTLRLCDLDQDIHGGQRGFLEGGGGNVREGGDDEGRGVAMHRNTQSRPQNRRQLL